MAKVTRPRSTDPLLSRRGFFAKVFEDVLQTLGLVDRKDPLTEMVAKKVVELATAGTREPDRLKALTVQAFIQQQQQQQQIKRRFQ